MMTNINMPSRLSLYIRSMRLKDSLLYVFLTIATIIFFSISSNATIPFQETIALVTIMAIFSLYSFCSNNFFDEKADKMNALKSRKNPYSSGHISRTEK